MNVEIYFQHFVMTFCNLIIGIFWKIVILHEMSKNESVQRSVEFYFFDS